MEVCLPALKESSKIKFDSYSARNSVLIISNITFRDCRVHIFSDNLSRNSCIFYHLRSTEFEEKIDSLYMNRLVFLKVNINQAPNAEPELDILEMQLK